MSVHAIDSVLAIPANAGLSHVERLMLLVLANRMSEAQGHCWPGMESIASQAGVSRSTALRAIQSLQDEGWIEVENRTAENGRKTTNLYRFTPQTFAYQNMNAPPDVAGGICQGVTLGLLAQKRQVSQPDTSLLTVTEEEKKKLAASGSCVLKHDRARENTSKHEEVETEGSEPSLFSDSSEKQPEPPAPSREGVQATAEETAELKAALEARGIFGNLSESVLKRAKPADVRRKLRDYDAAKAAGRRIGPGTLYGVLVEGGEISVPEGKQSAAPSAPPIPVPPREFTAEERQKGATWYQRYLSDRAARQGAANLEVRKTLTLGKDTRVTGWEAIEKLRREVATAHG